MISLFISRLLSSKLDAAITERNNANGNGTEAIKKKSEEI